MSVNNFKKSIIIEHISPPSDYVSLEKFMHIIDRSFTKPLSERVNIYEYSVKLAEKAEIFNVYDGPKKIANAAIYMNREYAFISSIAVISEYRKNGIGKMLHKRVVEEVKTKKIHTIELSVEKFNKKAIAFYKKLGYKCVDKSEEWCKMKLVIGE